MRDREFVCCLFICSLFAHLHLTVAVLFPLDRCFSFSHSLLKAVNSLRVQIVTFRMVLQDPTNINERLANSTTNKLILATNNKHF